MTGNSSVGHSAVLANLWQGEATHCVPECPDPTRWLLVHDVADLELKLIGLVVTVLSLVFLGQIVTWDGQGDLLGFGGSDRRLDFLLYGRARPHSKT